MKRFTTSLSLLLAVLAATFLAIPGAYADVTMARHVGRPLQNSVQWESRYRVRAPSEARLVFEPPLPRGTRLIENEHAVEHDSSGRIVSLLRGEAAWPRTPWEVRLEMPGTTVRPPYPRDDVPNVVTFAGANFDVSAMNESPLELRLGHVSHRDLDDETVELVEDWAQLEDDETPIYVLSDASYHAAGGLDAVLASLDWQSIRRWTMIIGLALVALLVSLVIFLLLKQQARREEVAAFLDDHEMM